MPARGARGALGTVRAWTLGSGSSGTALLVESGDHRILVDCGFGPRAIVTRLKAIGVAPESISALVLTHEHIDHAHGAERAQKKYRWPVYASAGTLGALREIEPRWRQPVEAGSTTALDGFTLEAIAVPHDASGPMAFVITAQESGARLGVVRSETVKFFGLAERGLKPFSLFRQHMDDDGGVARFGKFQNAGQQRQVMPINRAKVANAQLFKNQTAARAAASVRQLLVVDRLQSNIRERALECFLGFLTEPERQFPLRSPPFQPPFKITVQLVVARIGDEFVQVIGNRPDNFRDAPFVIVENTDEFFRRVRDVVQRLKRNPVRQRRITKNTDDIFVRSFLIARRAHPQGGGQGRSRVARAEAVMFTFRAQSETVESIRRANRVKAVFSPGQKLVDINLVAHVPDELVVRGRKDFVQRDRQLDDAEVGSKMPPVGGQLRDQFVANFLGQFLQLGHGQFLDV